MADGPVTGGPTSPTGEGFGGIINVPRQAREVEVPRQVREVDLPRQAREIDLPRQAREIDLPHQVRDERRGDVVRRHARLTGRGRPTFCSPSRAEQTGAVALPTGRGTDGKVIYPTREAAEAAARELECLGARRLRPYLCARSRHGHFHLATDTSRPLNERIPQQRRPA